MGRNFKYRELVQRFVSILGMMRDDFSQAVKTKLATRVGHHCSNPTYRAKTSGPARTLGAVVNIGVAAHITAASLGGPRYDLSLTPKERKSFENAIWLCQICAKLIDSDIAKFTVEVLREWKARAERAAEDAIGKPETPNAILMDARVQRAVECHRLQGTPKPEIDTWFDMSDQEKADWYDKIVFMVRKRPAKANPYRA